MNTSEVGVLPRGASAVQCARVFACAAILAFLGLGSCATDRLTTSDSRPMPPTPRTAPVTPSSARVNRMAFMVGSKPEDSNNNGFPDLIRATVALFASPYPTSIREDGAFVFMLYPQGQVGIANVSPIGSWRVHGDSLKRTLASAQYGPCYQFQLSLLESGGDALPLDRADIICRFEPADGSASVTCDGVRTIQIGRRFAAGM